MSQIYRVTLRPYDPSVPGVVSLYYASQGFVTKPTDTPANIYYDGRIQQPANVQRAVFGGSKTFGATTIGYGELVMVNNDGELDHLIGLGFDGREIVIELGIVTPSDAGVPTWITVLVGTMEQPEFNWDKVTVRVRDRQQDLVKPIQLNKYAGNNVLPSGLEGVAGDLMGKPKPRLYGPGFNLPVPAANTSKLVYQVSDGAIYSVPAVYDRGVVLTAGADYATSALLLAATPAAGTAITCLAEGLFRLGSSPVGLITCDAVEGATAAARSTAQIMKRMLLDAGLAAGDISSTDVTALDAKNSAEIGYWASHQAEQTFIAALDACAGSIGAWYGIDRTGIFRMGRIEAPSGTSVATITPLEIIKIDRVASQDPGKGIPSYKINLGYKRFYSVQGTDLAGGVTDARRSELSEEYRRVTSTDSTVKTAHLMATELTFDTLLIYAADAQTESDRRLALYKVRRDPLECRVALDSTLAASIDLGGIVTVQVPRFGYDAGKQFNSIGVRTDLRGGMLDLTLWG